MASVRNHTKPQGNKSRKPVESDFLDDMVQDDDSVEGVRMMVVGMEGVGKSSLGAFSDDPIYVCSADDHGIHVLRRSGSVPKSIQIGRDITDFYDLIDVLRAIKDGDHDRRTVVIDTLSFVQQMCFSVCCEAEYSGNWSEKGFYAFQQGPDTAATNKEYWPAFTDACTQLSLSGLNVILNTHAIIKPYKNPEGPDYDRYTPDLKPPIWKATSKWADVVLFMKPSISTEQEKGKRVKGTGGDQRLIHTEWSALCDAKNRYNMDPIMGPYSSAKEAWTDVWSQIQRALKGPEKEAPAKAKRPVRR